MEKPQPNSAEEKVIKKHVNYFIENRVKQFSKLSGYNLNPQFYKIWHGMV